MRYVLDPLSPTGLATSVESVIIQRQSGHGAVLAGKDGKIQSIVAGTNVTVNNADPNNPIISASGSGGGGSGITRLVTVTSGSFTAGNTSPVDYVYLIAGNHPATLPTASGNSNRYTFKNNNSANVTVTAGGSDTIDGAASISIAPSDSVDLISNNSSAWSVI